MAPLPFVAHALRADILWTDDADLDVLTRLHFAYAGDAPSAADCESIAANLWTAMETNPLDMAGPNTSLRGVDVIDLSGESAATGTHLDTSPGRSIGAGVLPAGVCALVNYQIARRYRGGKPRSYLPFGTGANIDTNGRWTSGFKTTLEANLDLFFAAAALITAGTTDLGGPISIGYYSGYDTPRPRSNGHLYYPPKPRTVPKVDPITGWTLNPKPGSQRRRNLHSS